MKPVFKNKDREKESGGTYPIQEESVSKTVTMIPKEEAEALVIRASEMATEKALASQVREAKSRDRSGRDDGEEYTGISSKMVKELQGIAGVFNALKEFSANPLQQAIEQKVGQVAAESINRVFSPPSPQNQDIIDRILNSQAGAGLGAGIGQRAPELIDKLMGTFGKEKTEQWLDGAISGKGGRGGMGSGAGGGVGQQGGGGGVSDAKQSDVDLILQLDPNNPEHITAYATSQGGIPHDVARKMLMAHQDAFIRQGKGVLNGNNINVQEYRRPVSTSYSDEQNLNVEQQKIDDDLKNRQIEPDALIATDVRISATNPQLEPEVIEMGQNGQTSVEDVKGSPSTNDYLASIAEMIANQNIAITQLREELDIIKMQKKNDDIEKVRENNEKLDEQIFSEVRNIKSVNDDEMDKEVGLDIDKEKKYPKGSMGWIKQQKSEKKGKEE
jgi:hypothetical protein